VFHLGGVSWRIRSRDLFRLKRFRGGIERKEVYFEREAFGINKEKGGRRKNDSVHS